MSTQHLVLNRFRATEKATQGHLYLGNLYLCDTLELGPGSNRPSLDRIPAGVHRLRLRTEGGYHNIAKGRWPTMHEGMVEIVVEGRTYILIHWGNFYTNTEGCILVGQGFRTDDDGQPALNVGSIDTYVRIYPLILEAARSGGTITILDEPQIDEVAA